MLLRITSHKYFLSWPGLTMELVTKHLPKSIATAKGHFDQEFKNLQSTKTASLTDKDVDPPQEGENIRTNDIMCGVFATSELASKSYLDQTGKNSVTSTQDNKYICIMYHYDTNSVYAVLIKSRHTQNISKAWEDVFNLLKKHGEVPNIHILDNECSFEISL